MKDINYRTLKDANGVKRYFVKTEGQWVEVEKPVYLFYAEEDKQARRKAKAKKEAGIQFISLDKLMDDYAEDDVAATPLPIVLQSISAEEEFFERSQTSTGSEFIEWLHAELPEMPIDRRVFFKTFETCNYSGSALAEKMDMPTSSVYYQLGKLYDQLAEEYRREGQK